MPHDKNGNLLQAGDHVVLHCTVKSVSPDADPRFCNATLETVEHMKGNGPERGKTTLSLSADMCEKVPDDDLAAELRPMEPAAVIESLMGQLRQGGERGPNREASLAITKLEEALLWLKREKEKADCA
ncbi:MAG: hypothetical protein KIT11_05435 [Fimbriimonadaceae bacterium]|nr:hypothetical protein [Fimbriimonadaceae bacterium]QYK56665.1 MAG: hypothetical protein KF733_04085 [Fimbriimonadaceae bacterium]